MNNCGVVVQLLRSEVEAPGREWRKESAKLREQETGGVATRACDRERSWRLVTLG